MIAYRTGTTDRTPGAWLIRYDVTPDRLTVVCDLALVEVAHLAVSLSTTVWTVDGVTYQTVRAETLPGEGKMVVYAKRVGELSYIP